MQQEEYRENFREMLCQCRVNGVKLANELGISYHLLKSWKNRSNRPTLFFVLKNYDKLVEISNRTEDTPEELYQKIIEGKEVKFPANYWKRENSYASAAKITRYAVEEVLHWNPIEVMTMLNYPVFKELKLGGMFNVLFNFDREQVIVNAYPEISWKNRGFQLHCTRWLIDKTGKLAPPANDFICYKLHPIIKLADRADLIREVHNIQNIDRSYEVRRFRRQCGLSVEEFAEMAGINKVTVYHAMNNNAKLSLEMEIKIMQTIRNWKEELSV